jgi:glutathione S-transferase
MGGAVALQRRLGEAARMAGVLSPSGETSMLVLRAAGTSPFVRKVRIVASVLDLDDRIEISAADTGNPEDSLRRQNPLGKIPALILENGEMIFDSAVIVDYLDWLAGGGKVIPSELKARLTQQSLADGIAEAAVLIRYERLWHEPPQRSEKWIAYQNEKIARERRRHDRARLSARLPRSRVRRGLARRSSAAGRVA